MRKEEKKGSQSAQQYDFANREEREKKMDYTSWTSLEKSGHYCGRKEGRKYCPGEHREGKKGKAHP